MCEDYDTNVLISDAVYRLMTIKAKACLRKIDVITANEFKTPRVELLL